MCLRASKYMFFMFLGTFSALKKSQNSIHLIYIRELTNLRLVCQFTVDGLIFFESFYFVWFSVFSCYIDSNEN